MASASTATAAAIWTRKAMTSTCLKRTRSRSEGERWWRRCWTEPYSSMRLPLIEMGLRCSRYVNHPLDERLGRQQQQWGSQVAPRPLADVQPRGEHHRDRRGDDARRGVGQELPPACPQARQVRPPGRQLVVVLGGYRLGAHPRLLFRVSREARSPGGVRASRAAISAACGSPAAIAAPIGPRCPHRRSSSSSHGRLISTRAWTARMRLLKASW
jgi:hypothetical protein